MHRYVIRYRTANDPCCPDFAWHCRAHSIEHAIERFCEGPMSEGWLLLDIERVRDRPQHRRVRHKLNIQT